jgi:hypothetical protein
VCVLQAAETKVWHAYNQTQIVQSMLEQRTTNKTIEIEVNEQVHFQPSCLFIHVVSCGFRPRTITEKLLAADYGDVVELAIEKRGPPRRFMRIIDNKKPYSLSSTRTQYRRRKILADLINNITCDEQDAEQLKLDFANKIKSTQTISPADALVIKADTGTFFFPHLHFVF